MIPAEFMTLDGSMSYRMVDDSLPPKYLVALHIPVCGAYHGDGDYMEASSLPLDYERYTREFELIDCVDGLAFYREVRDV